jgi:hypothetical protein
MTIEIQATTVDNKTIDMLIADSDNIETAKEWVSFCVLHDGDTNKHLAKLHLDALHRLRDVIGEEIQKITHSPNRKF